MYVFSLFGYSLPHSATSQWNSSGTYVERSDLQPGDLVMFCDPSRSKGKACSHVGIYLSERGRRFSAERRVCVLQSVPENLYRGSLPHFFVVTGTVLW